MSVADSLPTPCRKFVPTDDGCWEWCGSFDTLGRPRVSLGGRWQGAARVFHSLLIGPIPDGLQVDHLCLNGRCVNPAHLEAVTQAENVKRYRQAEARGDKRAGAWKRREPLAVSFQRTQPRHAPIDARTALAIYNDPRNDSEAARHFGVSRHLARGIRTGTHWADVTGCTLPVRRPSRQTVTNALVEIRDLVAGDFGPSELARLRQIVATALEGKAA